MVAGRYSALPHADISPARRWVPTTRADKWAPRRLRRVSGLNYLLSRNQPGRHTAYAETAFLLTTV